MSVKIRLARYGRLHKPYYRVVVIDSRNAREGLTLEVVGSYDPNLKEKQLVVDGEKVKAWTAKGAIVSEGLTSLMKHFGYREALPAVLPRARSKPKKAKDGKVFVKASRRAVRKHAAKQKAARKAAAAAAAPAPAAAEAPKA